MKLEEAPAAAPSTFAWVSDWDLRLLCLPPSQLGYGRNDAVPVPHLIHPWSWSASQPADLAFWFDLGPAASLWTCWVFAGLLADPGYHHRAWSWPWLIDLVFWQLIREAAAPACCVMLRSQLAFCYRATCPCCFLTGLKEKNLVLSKPDYLNYFGSVSALWYCHPVTESVHL